MPANDTKSPPSPMTTASVVSRLASSPMMRAGWIGRALLPSRLASLARLARAASARESDQVSSSPAWCAVKREDNSSKTLASGPTSAKVAAGEVADAASARWMTSVEFAGSPKTP